MIHPTLAEGDRVVLDVPENPRLHGQEGKVLKVTEYGAVVATDAAATGRFRAHWSEMGLLADHVGCEDDTVIETVAKYKPRSRMRDALVRQDGGVRRARESGYTGSICPTCQGCRMTRNGSCEKCEDCGTTSGCS